ncbi:MAG TPA: glycosyltransferase [Candidatus Nitrosotalea sp.]|nr:glycosyltransferase [Candidatus Nitrosotalea sp.]
MKVSVVIPVYNAEKYLDECIISALEQTYGDIEIIAVNDGSTDKSLDVLKTYSDKIKIIDKKNGGTPTALNSGINIMTGEWFKWLSADDVLLKHAIESLILEARKLGEKSKSTILYSNYNLVNKSTDIVGQFIEPNNDNLSNFEQNVILLDHHYGNGITSLIHKSVFDKCGLFDETIGFQEDYEFWLRCCLIHGCNMHLIPQILANYRIHEGQLTKKKINESLIHSNVIRNIILNKLSVEEKTKYVEAWKKYKKQKPLKVRIRRQIRDVMFRILPKDMSSTILHAYMNKKNTNY